MSRFLFSGLLVFNLLICPLRCVSCEIPVADNEDCTTTTCPCCQATGHEDSSDGRDQAPAEDCSCPNCICEGATLPAHPELAWADWQMAPEYQAVPHITARMHDTSLPWLRVKDGPPRCDGGRYALIAYQSWLI